MVIICGDQKFEMNITFTINKMVQAVDQRNYLSGKNRDVHRMTRQEGSIIFKFII